MQLFSLSADIITWLTAVVSAVFAILSWRQAKAVRQALDKEKQRQNRKIQIVLQYGGKEYRLPGTLRRADFVRSEILGYIGMIPIKEKGKRYALDYLNTQEFSRRINEISEADGDSVLTIPCREDEILQFDI